MKQLLKHLLVFGALPFGLNGCCWVHGCLSPAETVDLVRGVFDGRMAETIREQSAPYVWQDARIEPVPPTLTPATARHPAVLWYLMRSRDLVQKGYESKSPTRTFMPMGITEDGRIACASQPQRPDRCIEITEYHQQNKIGDIDWKRLEPNFCAEHMFALRDSKSCTDAERLLKFRLGP